MTKQRLSKLQKWILEKCYSGTKHCPYPYKKTTIEKGVVTRKQLLRDGDEFYHNFKKNCREVAVTNSIRSLFRKGLIDVRVMGYPDELTFDEYCKDRIKIWRKQIQRIKKDEILKNCWTGEVQTADDYEESINRYKKIMKERDLKWFTVKIIMLTKSGILTIKTINNKESLKIKQKSSLLLNNKEQ